MPRLGKGIIAVVDLASERPVLPLTVNRTITMRAMLDTGNPFDVLYSPEAVYKYGLVSLRDEKVRPSIGGAEVQECGWLDELSFGPIVYQHPAACLSHAFEGRDGLVGLGVLRHFNMIFDYPHSKIEMQLRE